MDVKKALLRHFFNVYSFIIYFNYCLSVDVLLNVFLAIAVDNISLEDEENKAEEEEAAAGEPVYV